MLFTLTREKVDDRAVVLRYDFGKEIKSQPVAVGLHS